MKNMRMTLLDIYWKTRKIIAPKLSYSQDIYEQVLKQYVNHGAIWLDLGCGHQILPAWREQEERRLVKGCKTIVGIDYDLPALQRHKAIALKVRGSITQLPFKDDCFDLITANMVVEHLDNPADQFREVHRVSKPGGTFIFHTPNAIGYFALLRRLVPNWLNIKVVSLLDGRRVEDIFKVHYKANTRKKIAEVASAAGFEVVKRRMIVSDAVFSVIPPIMIFELMWIRALMTEPLKPLRTNIIGVLRKPI